MHEMTMMQARTSRVPAAVVIRHYVESVESVEYSP